MQTVDPDPQAIEAFRLGAQSDTPIVMINLLRYRESAVYPEGFEAEPCTGREAYQRYGSVVTGLVGKAGGRPIWMGSANDSLIAPDDERWDDAILVFYPSRKAFLEMLDSDEYQAVKPHRTAALGDSRLIETKPLFGAGTE